MNPSMTHTQAAAPGEPSGYRFDHPRLKDVLNDMYIPTGESGPGDKLEPFELQSLDGDRMTSEGLLTPGQPLLLVFGSRTCPVTESAAGGLKELHALYGSQVRFVLVQVREAHPGSRISQPKTLDQKLRRAVDLKAHHRIPFEVAADDLEGTLHRRLGARPNSLYVIDSTHTIVFRAQWANETAAIAEALQMVVAGKAPRNPSVTRTFQAVIKAVGHMSPVLSAAGRGARFDTWRIAPPMGFMMILSDLLFFLPREKRGIPAVVLTILLMGGVAAVAAYAFATN
jgi:hypothetical protein